MSDCICISDVLTAITAKFQHTMLEFTDAVAINAVEDKLKMGLDRGAAEMMVATSDDAEFMAGVFTECRATEVFSTADPDESEAFVAARRFAIPGEVSRARGDGAEPTDQGGTRSRGTQNQALAGNDADR
jgi:hypothetical protein